MVGRGSDRTRTVARGDPTAIRPRCRRHSDPTDQEWSDAALAEYFRLPEWLKAYVLAADADGLWIARCPWCGVDSLLNILDSAMTDAAGWGRPWARTLRRLGDRRGLLIRDEIENDPPQQRPGVPPANPPDPGPQLVTHGVITPTGPPTTGATPAA